jgi:hypothetical protein
MTVGIAVLTTVASSAAKNVPVKTPAVTTMRRRADIESVGVIWFAVLMTEIAPVVLFPTVSNGVQADGKSLTRLP